MAVLDDASTAALNTARLGRRRSFNRPQRLVTHVYAVRLLDERLELRRPQSAEGGQQGLEQFCAHCSLHEVNLILRRNQHTTGTAPILYSLF